MECEYPKGIEVPTDVLSLVSKVSMVFSNDLPDDRQEILERDTSLWESRDYYDALSIYRDNMKATPTMAMSATTLPVMLNLMYRHGQSTYIDSDGKKRSIFHLADLILFSMAASTWESSSLSGLFSQKYGGICQDANSLRESLARFQNAIKSIEGEKRAADPRYALAQLWLGQSQVLLYDNGKKEDREAMKQSLPKAIADLERTQTQWSSPKAGDLKVRFDSELASLRKANDRMNAPWWDFRAGPGNTSLMPCPR
jgi:hypothetical protein